MGPRPRDSFLLCNILTVALHDTHLGQRVRKMTQIETVSNVRHSRHEARTRIFFILHKKQYCVVDMFSFPITVPAK